MLGHNIIIRPVFHLFGESSCQRFKVMLLAVLPHEFHMSSTWLCLEGVATMLSTMWLAALQHEFHMATMLLAILQHEFHMDPSAGRGTKNLFLANHMIFPCLSPIHGKFMDSSCGWPFYNMEVHVVKRPTTWVWPCMALVICSSRKYRIS